MQHPQNKIERSIIKIVAWTLGIIIFLIVGGVLGYKQFHKWQERRLVAQANALINEGDMKRASLDARRIMQINPDSAPGARIMARISEQTGSPAALEWRRRVVDLAPGDAADLIALARAAVRFDDKASRDLALAKLPESAKNTTEYHALAADLAAKKNDNAATAQHLQEAVRLNPSDKETRLRLAILQLGSNDSAARTEGQQALVQLQADPAFQRVATRPLADDALRRGDFGQAVELGRQLDSFPDKTFSDRLLLLTALHRSADPGSTPLLQEMQAAAATNPDQAAQLLSWLNAQQMPVAAISWASQLPQEMIVQKGVPIALADSYISARDWSGMQRMVKSGNWGGLDFLRSALAMRAARELANDSEAATHWNEALGKVSTNPKQALTLAELVYKWGWRDQAIELLWIAAKDPGQGDQALLRLYSYFASQGATPDLYRVLLRREEFHPNDRAVQNNIAQISLLLNLNADRGFRLARDLHQSEPKNPAYASTYAFALHTRGDTKKALAVMNGLTEEQQREPAIAAYYGILLAAAGEHTRAVEYLDAGEKAGLLPEERTLVDKARRTLARR
ncbi:MAG: hypothetical protein AVDCRST_MAG42-1724 [uncultured Chthoniobacterales bacterium]|uniref:Uncharacterized protein n=1 Tax=uncultured Chthoniobacterales bacterium TaxID=1836801 RepID=A0A6J4I565_9BACT|nr:MAG: hypothetical protein AVDCRST_MAG42-1724 [uncultured Chthoniobacterales bacterium]